MGVVGAPQPEQVIPDRPVALKPAEEAVARLRIDEVLELERAYSCSAASTLKPNISFRCRIVGGSVWLAEPLTVPM